jgi:hypothetical protein
MDVICEEGIPVKGCITNTLFDGGSFRHDITDDRIMKTIKRNLAFIKI